MKNQFHYTYVITNLINGKRYVGDHSTNNLDDGYLGSGRPYFELAKKKYGKENFKKEILEFFDTKQEAFDAQEKWIIKYKSHISENGYNISRKGGHNVKNCISEETKKKISQSNKGKKRTEESKKKISDSLKGKKRSKVFKRASNNHKLSDNTKEKIRQSRLGQKMSEDTKKKLSIINLNHSRQSKEKNSQFGTCWITNGIESKTINKGALIPEGWRLGRKMIKKHSFT